MIITRPDGSKVEQVTWQKPQVWTHQGYRCFMYQSSNQWLNWRCLKMVRPDGTEVQNEMIGTGINIGARTKAAKEHLKNIIEWDLKTPEEKEEHLKQVREQEQFLF